MYGASNIEDFEKSLSAESKLVRVPVNNLSAKAQRLMEEKTSPNTSNYYDLMATWKEGQIEQSRVEVPTSASPTLVGRSFHDKRGTSSEKSSQDRVQITTATPKGRPFGAKVNKSPLNSSVIPQTIEEEPVENDEDRALNSASLKVRDFSPRPQQIRDRAGNSSAARVFSEHDFNNRDSDNERSPHSQHAASEF